MSSDVIAEALDKTRARVAQRRLRLDDIFTDFDRLRSGRITREQFSRALTVSGIQLSEEELQALVDTFNVNAAGSKLRSGGGVEVNYVAFMRMLRQEQPPRESMAATRRGTSITQAEEERLQPVLKMLRHAVRVRGIDLVPAFRDMDPHHTGKVTVAQFERCIPFDAIDPGVRGLLSTKYGDGAGNVYYMMWCRDVDSSLAEGSAAAAAAEAAATGAASVTRAAGDSLFFSGSYRNPDLSVDELLRVLREQFSLYRLRCDDYFTDFDKFKTGIVSPAQFESALGRLSFVKFALTAENINVLIEAYTVNPSEPGDPVPDANHARINYKNFLYDTNPKNFPVLSASGAESRNYFLSTHAADTFLTDPAERDAANSLLEKVGRLVKAHRIFLSPVLRDFDRVRKMIYEQRTCTASRFARGLATQNLIFSASELSLLVRKYTVPHADGSPSQEVNYYQFVLDVDPSQVAGMDEEGPAGGRGGPGAGRSALAELQSSRMNRSLRSATAVDEVLQKIADMASARQFRAGEFFLDFDPLRSGSLRPEQFITALGIAGVNLQASELELLVASYTSTRVPRSVDTRAFLRDVGAFAPETIPSTLRATSLGGPADAGNDREDPKNRHSNKRATSVNPVALSEEDASALERLLRRLAHDVRVHGALLTPFFADFDRYNTGKITTSNFMQAITRHRFALTESEAALLCRHYAAPQNPDLQDYRRFIRDVGHDEYPEEATRAAVTIPASTGMTSLSLSSSSRYHGGPAVAPPASEEEVQSVLEKVCAFMEERNPRLQEFFPDGDELRHQHVTTTRFRHAVTILGLALSERELQVLECGFAKEMIPGEVDYPGFVNTVRTMMLSDGAGRRAATQRRLGTTNAPAPGSHGAQLYIETMDKIRRTLTSRRTLSLPAFREYDRSRKGEVKEGQFFACLLSLGVQLTPAEATSITNAYSIGNGEMSYVRFAQEVDDQHFAEVS